MTVISSPAGPALQPGGWLLPARKIPKQYASRPIRDRPRAVRSVRGALTWQGCCLDATARRMRLR
jgi:hypothetical protein